MRRKYIKKGKRSRQREKGKKNRVGEEGEGSWRGQRKLPLFVQQFERKNNDEDR